jgi:hypothetical protein
MGCRVPAFKAVLEDPTKLGSTTHKGRARRGVPLLVFIEPPERFEGDGFSPCKIKLPVCALIFNQTRVCSVTTRYFQCLKESFNMPEYRFLGGPFGGAKPLPRGTGIVISVGLAALALGAVAGLLLGRDVANSKGWEAAVLAAVVFTICIAALGFYRDRLQADKHREYLDKVSAIDRKRMRKD